MNAGLRIALCMSAASLSGCLPIGDCWPTVTAHVTLDSKIDVPEAAQVILMHAHRFYDTDVTGTDSQDIPVGSTIRSVGDPVGRIVAGQPSTFKIQFRGYPIPAWYYAVVDLNNNGDLDQGEPFGVDAQNPINTGCRPHKTTITIERIYK